MKKESRIIIKSPEELEILRQAGRILATIVNDLKRSLKVGITTMKVNELTEQLLAQYQVKSAFKGYRGFPGCACVSVNSEVVHGIPGKRVIKNGDILSVDVGIIHKGYYSDTAFSMGMGTIEQNLQKLLDVTQEALNRGIEQACVKNHLSDISHAVQKHVESNNFSIVRDFVGHGIGKELHEEPEIPNYGPARQGPLLKEGMVLAIEPMVNMGVHRTKVLKDGWTVVTEDGKPSAHFEHCILITDNGTEILTTA